jgi:hypothetical protein
LPIFTFPAEFEFAAVCRGCNDVEKWRCDNGWCIASSKLYDGIPDCPDSSDEHNREFEHLYGIHL